MASAQSGSLRSPIGYAPRPSYTPTPLLTPAMPTLPTVPTLEGDASLPNYGGRQIIAGQLAALPGQASTTYTGIKTGAQQRLAGYGGYYFLKDDPNTPQDESLQLGYDSTKAMGQRERQAGAGARNQANSANMLESSFANQNIAGAIQRTTLEAQAIANQYAQDINSAATSYSNTAASLVSGYAGLYGQDSMWAVDHPPPGPPGHSYTDAQAADQAGIDAHPGNPETHPQPARFEVVNDPPASAIAGLKKRGYKKAGGPGNRWVLKY